MNIAILTYHACYNYGACLQAYALQQTIKKKYANCKIIDYQKFLYQQKKKAKEMKANSTKIVIKEIRFGPNTDEHDFQFKLKHAIGFLQEGSKVKASVFFKGRSILYVDQGEKLLLRFAVELEEYGRAEQMPKLEGKRMIMMIAPVKKK